MFYLNPTPSWTLEESPYKPSRMLLGSLPSLRMQVPFILSFFFCFFFCGNVFVGQTMLPVFGADRNTNGIGFAAVLPIQRLGFLHPAHPRFLETTVILIAPSQAGRAMISFRVEHHPNSSRLHQGRSCGGNETGSIDGNVRSQ